MDEVGFRFSQRDFLKTIRNESSLIIDEMDDDIFGIEENRVYINYELVITSED